MEIDQMVTEIQSNVTQFLGHTKSWFYPKDIWAEYNIRSEEGKLAVRATLESMVLSGDLQHEGQAYRKYNKELNPIDWFNATDKDYISLYMPFELHHYLRLFPGVVVIAGEKGKGKSAWIYDCIFRNLNKSRKQYLFTNDAQDIEIKERFLGLAEKYNCAIPTTETLEVFERFDKFGDVVVNGGINYVDYLDVNSDFYSIGQEIDDIHRATGKGLTFIALQKNPKESLGVGGIYSWKRAQVYIILSAPPPELSTLWQGQLTLLKTRGRVNKRIDPTGQKWCYDILEGCKFEVEKK